MSVSEKVARPGRTALQATPAFVIVELIDSTFWDMTDRQYGALVAALTMVFAYGLVVVEEWRGKAVLRESAEQSVPVTS